jgi:gliding motility-associated-like protein
MKNIIYIIAITVLATINSVAQTSNKSAGCIPLTVELNAPPAPNYFWDFGDNGTSDLQSPAHIYTDAGEYIVRLYTDDTRSDLIGALTINVYADIIVDISSNVDVGCNPETIQFDNTIIKNDDIIVQGYLWTFGDGSSSLVGQPSYTYRTNGTFDVSLQVTTNFTECNKTIINEDMILIDDVDAVFELDKESECTIPATFSITNLVPEQDGYTYAWAFGNGITSTDYNPGSITYDENGSYPITLVITTPNGCTDAKRTDVVVGSPELNISVLDTTCVGAPIEVNNSSQGINHSWTFDSSASRPSSSAREPRFSYDTPGLKEVKYSVSNGVCTADTTFTILIPEKISSFEVIQKDVCADPGVLTLVADFPNMSEYFWNGNVISEGSEIDYNFLNPERDSNYINRDELVDLSLAVTSDNGCIDTSLVEFELQLPEAFFIPDSIIGLAPLTINFKDYSESSDSIVSRHWIFDDGTTATLAGDQDSIQHTFEAGRYFVKLAIENTSGCTDISKGTWIEALEFSSNGGDGGGGGFPLGGTPANLCSGNSFNWSLFASPAFDYHINTDDGRFDHCWKSLSGTYTARFPGTYDISIITEFKGFQLAEAKDFHPLEIPGARADIQYTKDCSDIYSVTLISNSENYEELFWKYGDDVISQSEQFDHTFTEKGPHTIYLEAHGDNDICEPSIDSVVIYVTEPIAVMKVTDQLCDNIPYTLDASMSQDVAWACGNNILWEFESQRPRAVNDSIVNHTFPAGKQNISLTVTDVNGCTDKVTQSIKVFGNDLSFVLDTSICFPNDALLLNTSELDTTALSWEWSIGSTEESPRYTFTEADLHPVREDTIEVQLSVIDALGCVDTLVQHSRIYEPFSSIDLSQDNICVGSDLEVRGGQFTEEGSFLNYNWDFGIAGIGSDQEEVIQYDSSGLYTIFLHFQEEGSGCGSTIETEVFVVDRPIASFSSSVDSLDVICYPHTIAFDNTSFTDGPIDYSWSFGNGSNSILTDPATTFDKGTFTTTLTVESEYGCSDSFTTTYELVGPSGDLVIDAQTICAGQEIMLELRNPEDVSAYNWDLGDGTVIVDQNPISYTYDGTVNDQGRVTVDLVIKSSDTGCENIQSVPVIIQDVNADFSSSVDSIEFICSPHQIQFNNLSESVGTPQYRWDFGDNSSSSALNPGHSYEKGNYTIELISSTSHGCRDTAYQEIAVVGPSASVIIEDDYICLGDFVHLELSDQDDIGTIVWDFGDGNTISDEAVVDYQYQNINQEFNTITLELTSAENGCMIEEELTVRVHEVAADFETVEGRDYCYGTIDLVNTSIGADLYNWDFGDNMFSEEENVLYTYDSLGVYPVMLTATHIESGCQDTATIEIEPTDGTNVYDFPNVFSPNGDGNNDVFNAYINDTYENVVNVNRLEIYNRWGKQVYSGSGQQGWDGVLNGNILEPDVYAFFMEIVIKDCTVVTKKGNVTLIR